jgi:hypothetical protein
VEGERGAGSIAGSQPTVQIVSLRAPRVMVATNILFEEAITESV